MTTKQTDSFVPVFKLFCLVFLLFCFLLSGCKSTQGSSGSELSTSTPGAPTATQLPTNPATPSATPSNTPTTSPTYTPAPTFTPTLTPTPTPIPVFLSGPLHSHALVTLGKGILIAVDLSPAGDRIASGSPAVNLCGRTSLADAIDVLALAEQAVSNDSGLMHIAAAVGTHVHGIYGSSSPAFTPPLTRARTIHHLGIDCSPCFERECPLGHLKCLRNIDPLFVAEAIDDASMSLNKT